MAEANYVKFLRGTPTAYNNLTKKDSDTLYFVSEKDSTVGKLDLGNVRISDSLNEEGLVDYLSELKDVDTSGAVQNSLLGFDSNKQKWIAMDVSSLLTISEMVGASAEKAGTAGLVPAPSAGEEQHFLRGDGTWALTPKHNIQIFENFVEDGKTHEETIAEAVGTSIPILGDIAIVKEIISEEKIQYTSYIYNGLSWIVLNGEYSKSIDELYNLINDLSDAVTGDNGLSSKVNDLENSLSDKADKQEIVDLETALSEKASNESVNTLVTQLADKANKADVYTKTETDSAIAEAVTKADHLTRKIVDNYEDIQNYIDTHDDADKYIFMVPTIYNYTLESNKYDEYIVLKTISEDNTVTYTIELVGSWEINLDDYVSEEELKTYLESQYYTNEQINTLLNNKVDKVFYDVPVVDENGDPIFEEDGTTPKMEQVEGSLLSPEDRKKLDSLVIGEEGVEISGKVNAANVEGLNEWITNNRNNISGLYPAESESNLNKAISDLNSLTETVGKNTDDITAINTRVDNLSDDLTNYVSLVDYQNKINAIDADINTLKQAMTWEAMAEQ